MNRTLLALALSLALLAPAGCKFVKTEVPAQADGTGSTDPDDVLIAGIVKDTYDAKLLPLIATKAMDAPALFAEIKSDLNAAGTKSGNKGAGEGSPWAFPVKGKGVVVAEDRKSRAGKVELDVNGDNAADLTLQIGPVVKGTALRDVAPFYIFTEFRDQIQFAKLGRALNDRTITALKLPDGDLKGKTISFTGVFSVSSADAPVLVTPVNVEVMP